MSGEERIAKALEERNEILMGIIKGILYGSLIIIGFFVFMMFGNQVYGFFYYDVLGNEDPFANIGISVPNNPIDDCSYSDDKQLCYQMERIANALENENLQSGETQQ